MDIITIRDEVTGKVKEVVIVDPNPIFTDRNMVLAGELLA
jgi:hypothetical protein